MMDELKAMNMMLAAIGEAPVTSVDSTLPEAKAAREALRLMNLEVQSIGLHCNTDYDVELTQNQDGNILVPTNALQVIASDSSEDIVVRGIYLYDRKNRTFYFNGRSIKVKLVTKLSFDDLPEPYQYYIAVRAARVFAHQVVGAQDIERYTATDEMRAKVVIDGIEMKNSRHRMIDYYPAFGVIHRR